MDIQVAHGKFTGTGALFTVNCGFRPFKVEVYNATGDCGVHLAGMPAASLQVFEDAFDTSAGITLTDTGFTIGADGVVNVSTQEVRWVAWGL